MADAKELAKQLADHIKQEAAERWPGATLLNVIDGAGQITDGYVWCDLAGQTVRCVVPSAIDLTGGSQVIYAVPLENGTNDYICIGLAWNGLDNSRLPRQRVAAISDINGNPITGGGGSVTSVALSAAPAGIFDVSGSPVTTSGTLALSMDNQSANTFLRGPTSGGAAAPAFGAIVQGDLTGLTLPVDMEGIYGETIGARDYIYLKAADNKFYQVDIDDATPEISAVRGFAVDAGNANDTGTVRLYGALGGFTGLTAGALVYAHTTAGGYTQTKPTVAAAGVQKVICIAGFAISTTEVFVQPHPVEYAKRDTLANNGTLTVVHHADADVMTRDAKATIYTTTTGASLTSYDTANKDLGVPLRGPSGAGATTTITATGTVQGIGDAGGVERASAQGFMVTAGRLTQFTVTHDSNVGTPTGTITWKIHTDNAGKPSSTVLYQGTYTPVASSVNTITLSGDYYLEGATQYHLALYSTNNQTLDNRWRWTASSSSTYANGYYNLTTDGGSSWTSTTTSDCSCSFTTVAVSVGDKLAQGIQVTGDQTVGVATLYMAKAGSPTGTMTLRIETDNAGSPSGTLVDANATTTLAESGASASYANMTFTFATAFTLTGSTQYHLVLSTDRASSNTNYVLWGSDSSSPGYTSGVMKSEASSSWSAESKDACFDVLSPTTTYQEPCTMGRWSGGTRDVAVRYDDGAAANPTTKTTFKNTTGGSVDMTVLVRLP